METFQYVFSHRGGRFHTANHRQNYFSHSRYYFYDIAVAILVNRNAFGVYGCDVMRFVIFRQPAFLIAIALFLLHQISQKCLGISLPIADNYLDTFLCTPIFLFFLLFERRYFYKLGATYTFSIFELIVVTAVIIFISEILFPYLSTEFIADSYDVLMLILGSIYFYCFINRH